MDDARLTRRFKLAQLVGYDEAAKQEGVSKETLRRECRRYKEQCLRMDDGAKILLLDIETAPSLAYIWSLWQEPKNFKFVEHDWYILSWSAKWLGSKSLTTKALPDYPGYKKDPRSDKALLEDMWKLLDEASIVVGHNGKRFDLKKLNARFVTHGMPPPSPYRIVDTLLEAKSSFAFTSNRLDSLGEILQVGRKEDTGGFELWRGCLNGDMAAWAKMKKYNAKDVILLERVYMALRPYMKFHPNFGAYTEDDIHLCAACGSSNIKKSRSFVFTDVSKYAKYRCKDCGAWSRGRKNLLTQEKRDTLLTKSTPH